MGQAIVFIAPISAPSGNHYCHLMVWEAFAAGEQEMNCVCSEKDVGWWCKNGPQQLQKWAGAARQWTEHGTQGPLNATKGFEIKLSDGKSVRLVALCRPSVAPFCWWDAHGNPAAVDNSAIPMRGNPPSGLWALVRVDGPGGEYGLESPIVHGAVNDSGKYERIFCESIEDAASLDVSVSIGPWKEGAKMKRAGFWPSIDANLVFGRLSASREREQSGDSGFAGANRKAGRRGVPYRRRNRRERDQSVSDHADCARAKSKRCPAAYFNVTGVDLKRA